MRESDRYAVVFSFLLLFMQTAPALGQEIADSGANNDDAALSLEGAPPPIAGTKSGTRNNKIFIEGAVGNSSQRYQLHSQDTWRTSLDITHSAQLHGGLRAVLSDRLDHIHPRGTGLDETVNSLREAYLSWQPEDRSAVVEFGRINLRYGPGYGFNPTDFFRDSSVRALTTADPFALRENRLGSVMLRAQRVWTGGSLSVAYSPKLASQPSSDGWSLDLGSTNNRDRGLIVLGTQISEWVSSELFVYKQEALAPTVGANATALISDAAVGYLEWTRGKEPELVSRALTLPRPAATRNRFVGGVTYTTLSKLSLTAEYEYNGFALGDKRLATFGPSPTAQMAYFYEALRLQDLASRHAVLIYVSQKNLLWKNLDMTAYLRLNAGDHSRLAWIELRRHWSNFDLTLQVQRNIGRPASEFGILPDRGLVQALGTYYF